MIRWDYIGMKNSQIRRHRMPELHIKLAPKVHKAVSKKAKEWNFTNQEFVERAIEYTAGQTGKPIFLPEKTKTANKLFTFIDLFAGIGGIRIAFEKNGGECVWSCEWDSFCQKTYLEYFHEKPEDDIRKFTGKHVSDEELNRKIPDHDILTAGFPCQPFSIAGVSKKNALGMDHGFKCKAQGTLFFDILRILEVKRPKMFLLENVKNLRSHDKGNTFKVIKGSLEELRYKVYDEILDAQYWVPQHRERIFLVGFDKDVFGEEPEFNFPTPPSDKKTLKLILEKRPDSKYTLTDHLWEYLQNYKKKHEAKGNGFGFGLVSENDIARTLSARYYKDGSEILIDQGPHKNPRRLTIKECAKLMGFPQDFYPVPVSDTQAYKQFGNSVVVPVVTAVAKEMIKSYQKYFPAPKA